jgi:hypothetical protein
LNFFSNKAFVDLLVFCVIVMRKSVAVYINEQSTDCQPLTKCLAVRTRV